MQKQPLSQVLLVTDMDDTLLNKDKEISPIDQSAIAHFRALGGQFTIASGRSVPSYHPYLERLQIAIPVILNNGAIIYDPNQQQLLWHCVLPEEAKRYIQDVVIAFPQIGAEVMTEQELFVVQMSQIIRTHIKQEFLEYRMARPDELPKEWFKVLFALEEEEMPTLKMYFEQHPNETVTPIISSKHFCELLPAKTSKGFALQKLVQLLQFEEKQIYAIGDYWNDVELIQTADVGYAMGHAPDGVKEKADKIAPDHDAISYVIDQIIKTHC